MSPADFTTQSLSVNVLDIDYAVQRKGLNLAKVRKIKKRFNEAALGYVTVSFRKDHSYIVLDGMHRVQAVKEMTDNQGEVLCHVFTGLTLAEEAQIFLDKNETTAPRLIDKYLVTLNAEGEDGDVARDIRDLVGAYGWTISHIASPGHINAISALTKLYKLSKSLDAYPNLVQLTILVITRAWGNDRHGVNSTVLEGLGRMFAEYGERLDVDILIETMKAYKGGPQTLHTSAQQMASLRQGKVSMAVAELLVDEYNKGRRSKKLETWRARS